MIASYVYLRIVISVHVQEMLRPHLNYIWTYMWLEVFVSRYVCLKWKLYKKSSIESLVVISTKSEICVSCADDTTSIDNSMSSGKKTDEKQHTVSYSCQTIRYPNADFNKVLSWLFKHSWWKKKKRTQFPRLICGVTSVNQWNCPVETPSYFVVSSWRECCMNYCHS